MWSSGEVADPRLGDKGSGFTKVDPRPTEVSQLGECTKLTERRVLAVQTVITRLAAGSLTNAYLGRDGVPNVPAERKYDEGLLGVVLLSGPHQPRNLKLTTDAAPPHTNTHTHTHVYCALVTTLVTTLVTNPTPPTPPRTPCVCWQKWFALHSTFIPGYLESEMSTQDAQHLEADGLLQCCARHPTVPLPLLFAVCCLLFADC